MSTNYAFTCSRQSLLDEPLFRAGRQCLACGQATYGLILNPAKFSTEERWFRAVSSLAPGAASSNVDPQRALFSLVARSGRSFLDREMHRRGARQCSASARGNQLGDVGAPESPVSRRHRSVLQPDDDAGAMRVVTLVREGSYRFNGITATTINHDEAWHFIQLGKYIERAC